MVNSIETNPTKSSIISGKATSLKKSMQKGVKAIARPFKKLKNSISTASMHSIRSRSSIAFSISDDENVNHDNVSSVGSEGDGGRSEPEVELTPQEELSMSFIIISSSILIISASEALQKHWCSPIYTFFKPDVIFQSHDGRPSHFFTCAAPKCKVHAGGVRPFQDLKDRSSTTNLKHHTLHCFGEDAVNAAIAGKEHTNCSHGILGLFTRKGKQPVKYSHCVHTNPEVRYVPLLCIYSYANADH